MSDAARIETLERELAASRAAEARYRRLAELAADLILVTTPEGDVQYVSPSCEPLLGFRPAELVGRKSYALIEPADLPVAMGAHLGALNGQAPAPVTYRVRRSDGELVWLEVLKSVVPGVDGGAVQVQSISRDVSARVRAEAEAERFGRMRDQFLSILSHELRTPINAIMGFASILEDGLVGQLPERQRELTGKILDASERLLALVSDLLDLSRIQAGQFTIEVERLDLAAVVRTAAEDLAYQAARRGIDVSCELPADLPTVPGDSARIRQVVANLVGNAIKFTPEGGRVRIRLACDDQAIRCEVADTGPGIAPADVERIFAPFVQLDMSSTRAACGAGLGLAICRALVEAHDGAIGVLPAAGGGSAFWFTLPRARSAVGRPAGV